MPERRRESPGRRSEDLVLEVICKRLDRIEDRMVLHDGQWREAVKEVDQLVDRYREKMDARVDGLEEFHIIERAKIGERTAEQVRKNDSRVKWSLRVGIVGSGLGAIAVLYELATRGLGLF